MDVICNVTLLALPINNFGKLHNSNVCFSSGYDLF